MSTTTKHLLTAAATVAFALAATATSVTNAFAQTAPSVPVAEKKAEQPAGKTRAEVQAEFLAARNNGTLIETEVDSDVAQTRKHIVKH